MTSSERSSEFQQMMLTYLGYRDYDIFEYNELHHLEDKIGFALYGPPTKLTGYEEKQKTQIKFLFNAILRESNHISKFKDRVKLSFVYNCVEPLPKEKEGRAKKNSDYSPGARCTINDKKCKRSPYSCRVFIDHTTRVYQTWKEYLTENTLPECNMTVPMNGQYLEGPNGEVLLERHPSPACNRTTKILKRVDIASTVGRVLSGIVLPATAAAPISAPIVLAGAAVMGISTGVYSIGRSIYNLVDRSNHKEDSTKSYEDYFNIVNVGLGFMFGGMAFKINKSFFGPFRAVVVQNQLLYSKAKMFLDHQHNLSLNFNNKSTARFVVTLNGVVIEQGEFSNTDKKQKLTSYLGRPPIISKPTESDIRVMSCMINYAFNGLELKETEKFAVKTLKILGNEDMIINQKIINAVGSIVKTLLDDQLNDCMRVLDGIFPHNKKYLKLIGLVSGYFQKLVDETEKKYQEWLPQKKPLREPYFNRLSLDSIKRAAEIFNFVTKDYYVEANLTEYGLKTLQTYFYKWFGVLVYLYENNQKRRDAREKHSNNSSAPQVRCPTCNGFFYDGTALHGN